MSYEWPILCITEICSSQLKFREGNAGFYECRLFDT